MKRDMQEIQDVYRKGQSHFTTVKKKGRGERKKDGEATGTKIKAWVSTF